MSARDVYDFDGAFETAAKSVLTGMQLKVFTTQDKPDFQKERPRIEIKFTLGAGLQRFVPIINGAIATPATPDVTPALLFFCRRESARAFNAQFDLITAADISSHADFRAQARNALAQLWQLINGAALPRHCVQLSRDGGSSPILIAPEQGMMKTEMSFGGTISIQQDAWPALLTA